MRAVSLWYNSTLRAHVCASAPCCPRHGITLPSAEAAYQFARAFVLPAIYLIEMSALLGYRAPQLLTGHKRRDSFKPFGPVHVTSQNRYVPNVQLGKRDAARLAATPEGATASTPAKSTDDKKAGRMTYKPASYAEMVDNAVDAVSAAIADGLRLMEVEFPALPVKLDGKHQLPANWPNRQRLVHSWEGAWVRWMVAWDVAGVGTV